jgi:ammonium transporter, Amt family
MVQTGDYAWIMASSALVFMMVPGIALFYSGLRSQSTALSLIWLSMMTTAVVTIQVLCINVIFSTRSYCGDN